MRIFWEKTVIIISASGAQPQTPAFLLPPTITSLSSSFLVLNAFFPLEKEPSNYCKNVLPLLLPHFCTYFLNQTL